MYDTTDFDDLYNFTLSAATEVIYLVLFGLDTEDLRKKFKITAPDPDHEELRDCLGYHANAALNSIEGTLVKWFETQPRLPHPEWIKALAQQLGQPHKVAAAREQVDFLTDNPLRLH